MPKGVYVHVLRAVADRFWEKVDKTNGCWLWRAGINRYGYGHFGMIVNGHKGMHRANRVAWELIAGPIPPGDKVLHTCDVRHCVRNEPPGVYVVDGREVPTNGHLFLGSTLDNSHDARSKGRSAKGSTHGLAKLTADNVREIRARCAAGETQRSVAQSLGVHFGTVNDILQGKYWTHID